MENSPTIFNGIKKKSVIKAKGLEIGIYSTNFEEEFISLTDIARYRSEDEPRFIIQNWMKNQNTIEFLAAWEMMHNPNFKGVQMHTFKIKVGSNRFIMTPEKWIRETDAIGIKTSRGRYSRGTYAHADIAMSFATWISPEFQLYIMKDYRRLKQDESERKSLDWNLRREISKLNYKIQTDAIEKNLILPELTDEQISNTYASEADLLNVALFGMTAKEWTTKYKGTGNLRDNANLHQLLVLANMESYNAVLIKQGYSQGERLVFLRELALEQLRVITEGEIENIKKLGD